MVYEHPFFAGARFDINQVGQCVTFPNEWNNKVSSMTLETKCTFYEYVGSFYSMKPYIDVRIYSGGGCNEDFDRTTLGPGSYGEVPNDLDERISSFQC